MFAKSFKVFLLLSIIFSSISGKAYDGFKIVDVKPRSLNDLQILETLSKNNELIYDFFGKPKLNRSSRIMIHPEKILSFLNLISKYSIDYQVINENFGETIERDMKFHQKLKELRPFQEGERLGTGRYYSHDEINRYLSDLEKRYPKRVYVKTVGKSYEGRPLKTITITNGDGRAGKHVILIDGGIHAREWISPAAAVYIIGELVENFEENFELLLNFDWIILPVVNPDGYEYSQKSPETRMWRKTRKQYSYGDLTCYGADLNRNFGYHWNETNSSPYPCDGVYAGPKAFSEPEAITLRDIMKTLQGRGVMYITLHSYGGYLLYPWGYEALLPENRVELQEIGDAGAEAIFKSTGYEYTVGSSAIVLYSAAGASDDYAFSIGFPLVFTMEIHEGGETGFDPKFYEIGDIVTETWIGIRTMAREVLEKYRV